MHLRSIVLAGFKTFARQTEIAFDPGVTAIVGPNGSGKSNTVDAFKRVLGETRASDPCRVVQSSVRLGYSDVCRAAISLAAT